jgi:hypothetical protein
MQEYLREKFGRELDGAGAKIEGCEHSSVGRPQQSRSLALVRSRSSFGVYYRCIAEKENR